MKYTELASDYFERHSLSTECHITSDGRVFHTIGHAMSFSQENSLKPQTIESYNKDLDTGEITSTENFAPIESGTVEELDQFETNEEPLLTIVPQELLDENPELAKEDIKVGDTIEILDPVFETPAGEMALDVFLKNSHIDSLKYDDLKKLAKHFKIETADQKAETLKTALIEFKNSLN